METYKGTEIKMWEGNSYKQDDLEITSEKLFFVASSKFGRSFANNPQQALEGARQQVDTNTK